MIERQTQSHLFTCYDPVFGNYWLPADTAHTEDGAFGPIDYRREGGNAKGAEGRKRERPEVHLSSGPLAPSGAVGEVVSFFRHLFERKPRHVVDHRSHQARPGGK